MAKLVGARGLGPRVRKNVGVRVPPPAQRSVHDVSLTGVGAARRDVLSSKSTFCRQRASGSLRNVDLEPLGAVLVLASRRCVGFSSSSTLSVRPDGRSAEPSLGHVPTRTTVFVLPRGTTFRDFVAYYRESSYPRGKL